MRKIFAIFLLVTASLQAQTSSVPLFLEADSIRTAKAAYGFKAKFFKVTDRLIFPDGTFMTTAGEANTASNLSFFKLFKDKVGVDLRFKGIYPVSNKIAINDATDSLGIDVTEANLTLSNLGGAVTDAQVPNTITLDNITQVTTRPLTSLTGTLGSVQLSGTYSEALRFSNTTNDYFGDTLSVTQIIGAGGGITALNMNNASAGTLAVARGGTGLASYTANNLLYASGTTTIAGLATANNGVLVTSGTGVPSIATDIPTAVTIGGQYIYRVGGTKVSLADGGTNASLTASTGAILYSTATALALATGTNNHFVRWNTSGAPGSFDLFGTANTFTAAQTVVGTASVTGTLYLGSALTANIGPGADFSNSIAINSFRPTGASGAQKWILTIGGSGADNNPATVISSSNSDGTNNYRYLFLSRYNGGVQTGYNVSLDPDGTSGVFVGNNLRVQGKTYLAASTGNVGIGTETFGTNAAKVLGIFNGTAPTSSPADMVQLYAEDVSAFSELKVRDEAGNVTVLSPHEFQMFQPSEAMAWTYSSRNAYIGKEISVDMLKLARLVERLSGEQLVYIRDLPEEEVEDWDANQYAHRDSSLARIADWNNRKEQYEIQLAEWNTLTTEEREKKPKPSFDEVKPIEYKVKAAPNYLKPYLKKPSKIYTTR